MDGNLSDQYFCYEQVMLVGGQGEDGGDNVDGIDVGGSGGDVGGDGGGKKPIVIGSNYYNKHGTSMDNK